MSEIFKNNLKRTEILIICAFFTASFEDFLSTFSVFLVFVRYAPQTLHFALCKWFTFDVIPFILWLKSEDIL